MVQGHIKHTIQPGDTISSIAQKLGVTEEAVQNSIVNGDPSMPLTMIPGNTLDIPNIRRTHAPEIIGIVQPQYVPDDSVSPEDISYASEASVDTDMFKGIANEVNAILKRAYVLYLEANREYLKTIGDANALAQSDWLQANVSGNLDIFREGYQVNPLGTGYEKIDTTHLTYKKYAFELIQQLVNEGYEPSQLPSQIYELYQVGDFASQDYLHFLLSEISVEEFERALQDAQLYMLENKLVDSGFYDQIREAATGYSEAIAIDENYAKTLREARALLS